MGYTPGTHVEVIHIHADEGRSAVLVAQLLKKWSYRFARLAPGRTAEQQGDYPWFGVSTRVIGRQLQAKQVSGSGALHHLT